MTGVELLQNGIGRTLGFLGRAGAMISITLLSRAEDEPEYQEAKRLLKFMDYFLGIPDDSIPNNSLLREFIGGGCFRL